MVVVSPDHHNAKKTHCPRGHAYDAENTRYCYKPNGGVARRCWTCTRAAYPAWTPKFASDMDRFMAKVRKEPNTCWTWLAHCSAAGYGKFSVKSKYVAAHRWIYRQTRGDFDTSLSIDHLCRNPSCVNPYHMEAVPILINVSRGTGGICICNASKMHCPQGHPYNGWNLLIDKSGGRRCRTCEIARTSKGVQRPRQSKRAFQQYPDAVEVE